MLALGRPLARFSLICVSLTAGTPAPAKVLPITDVAFFYITGAFIVPMSLEMAPF